MPTQSKPKRQIRKERRRLHEAVDRILDGPNGREVDEWVVQVLVDIGSVIRAAAPALDYEAGRVISGVDRRHGDFDNISWRGAGIITSPQEANAWIEAGMKARGDMPSPEIQQRALAAVLRPIANISLHSWLIHLAKALDALRFGDVRPPLQPSNRGLWGGVIAWQQRLAALRWVEFQVGARKIATKDAARQTVAKEFGVPVPTIKDWPRATRELFGPAAVREELELARRLGEHIHQIKVQIERGKANERDRRYCTHMEAVYSQERLKEMGERFKTPTRKKQKRGK